MNEPKKARLMSETIIEPFGGPDLQMADLDGDGRLEFVVMQHPGQFKSRFYDPKYGIDDVDKNLFCVTAVNIDGDVLWQYGKPYNREFPFTTHGSGQILRVDDVDGDGTLEVIALNLNSILIINGVTGELKNRAEFPPDHIGLPTDNYCQIFIAKLDASGKGKQILCKVNDITGPDSPWSYANPMIVYNNDLTIRHAPFEVKGAGHNMAVFDVDSDGCDEVLVGYSLLDNDMTEIWSVPMPEGFNYAGEHADHILLADITGDGVPEILYSGSKDFMAVNLSGQPLWRTEAGHSQYCQVGPWGSAGEIRIIMTEKWRGLTGLNADGKILWQRKDLNGYVAGNVRWSHRMTPNSWALFAPQIKPVEKTPCWSDPDWSRRIWPQFMDGEGTLYDVLPWKEHYSHPKQWLRAARVYDNGITYSHQGTNAALIADLDNDGLDEIVIHDRYRILVFHSPE